MKAPTAAPREASERSRGSSRRLRRRSRGLLAILATALAIGVVVLAPLAVGGVHRPTLIALSCATLAGVISLAISERRAAAQIRLPLCAVFPAAFVCLAGLQMLPLPESIVRHFDPNGSRLLAEGGGWTGTWRTWTLDRPATVEVFARSLAALLMFLISYHLTTTKRTRGYWLIRAVAATGVGSVIIGLGHRIFSVPTIYGLFANGRHAALLTGPFINANHTAELLELCTFTAIACGRQTQSSFGRIGWYGAAAINAAGSFATLSRSALFAQGIGILVIVLGTLLERPSAVPKRRPWLPIVVGLITVGLVATSIGADQVLERLHTNAVGGDMRLPLWRDSLSVLQAHPFGIGRGAFDVVYPIYRKLEIGRPVRFSFVENEPLQMLIDYGYVGFVLLTAAAFLTLRDFVRNSRRDPTEIALLAGVAAVAAHSVTDFGLETPGVLLPFVCVLGTMFGRAHRSKPNLSGPMSSQSGIWTAGVNTYWSVGFVLTLGVGTLWEVARPSGRNFDNELKSAVGAAEQREVIVEARKAHPLDYYYPLALSAIEPLSAPGKGYSPRLRALNQALILCKNCPEVHLQVARNLWRLGQKSQSLAEWAAATRVQPAIFRRSLVELGTLGATPMELARLAEGNPEGMLELADFLLAGQRPELAGPIIAAAAEAEAPSLEIAVRRARMALATFSDPNAAGQAIAEAKKAGPSDVRVALIEAEYVLRQGGKNAPAEALELIERALDRTPSDLDLQRKRIEIVSRFERWSAAERSIAGYKAALQDLGRSTVEANTAAAAIYLTLGRVRDAMAEYRIATTMEPLNVTLWRQFASSAEAARQFLVARDAYHELMRLAPGRDISEALRRIDDEQAAQRLGARPESTNNPMP